MDRDLVGYGFDRPKFRWPGDKLVAVQLVVNYEEGSEISYALGDEANDGLGEVPRDMPAGTRDLCVESIYEYGSRAGVWRLLRLFEELRVPVTFFAAAKALELNPAVATAITACGHEVCAHGYRWAEHFRMSREEEAGAIAKAVRSIERLTGERPSGWYCRYCPSVNTRELLVEEGGFLYDADAYNDDLPYYTAVSGSAHLVVPYSMDANDSRYVRGTGFANGGDFAAYLIDTYDWLAREASQTRTALMMSVGTHPRFSGRPGRAAGLRRFIEYIQQRETGWFARRDEIARFWMARFPAT